MLALTLVFILVLLLGGASADVLAKFNAQNPLELGTGPLQMFSFAPNPNATLKVEGDYIVLSNSPYSITVPPGPGGNADHVKFLTLVNTPWVLPTDGNEIIFSTNASFQCGGTKHNPFDVNKNDLRLCAAGLINADLTLGHVSDFLVTNKKIYAFYERLDFFRTAEYNYAAYSSAIPVADRKKEDFNSLQIAYNAKSKYIRWMVDGKEVFRVNSVGMKINSDYVMIDEGGKEELSFPTAVSGGLGLFTILDGYTACTQNIKGGALKECPRAKGDEALVRLKTTENTYFLPGSTKPATFMSDGKKDSDRIWGQGASIYIDEYVVSVGKAPK